jgi:hypothetical protein
MTITSTVGRYTVHDHNPYSSAGTMQDGTPLLSDGDVRLVELRAAQVVFARSPEVGGHEFVAARKSLGLRIEELARVLDVSIDELSRTARAKVITRVTQLAMSTLLSMALNDENWFERELERSKRSDTQVEYFEIKL